jgi:hypothetical protein
MDKSKLLWLGAGIVLGIILQPQISKLPLVSKLPTV